MMVILLWNMMVIYLVYNGNLPWNVMVITLEYNGYLP